MGFKPILLATRKGATEHKPTNHTPTDRPQTDSKEPAECIGTVSTPLPHGLEEASVHGLRLGPDYIVDKATFATTTSQGGTVPGKQGGLTDF